MPLPILGLVARGALLGFGLALGWYAGRKAAPRVATRLNEAADDLDLRVRADHSANRYYTDLFDEDDRKPGAGR
jgi:hypothetical protein